MKRKDQLLTDLLALKKLFAAKRRWTQQHWARDKDGADTQPTSRKATCWCLSGGCHKVTKTSPLALSDQPRFERFNRLYKAVANVIYHRVGMDLVGFNDRYDTTPAAIQSVVAEAVKHRREELACPLSE